MSDIVAEAEIFFVDDELFLKFFALDFQGFYDILSAFIIDKKGAAVLLRFIFNNNLTWSTDGDLTWNRIFLFLNHVTQSFDDETLRFTATSCSACANLNVHVGSIILLRYFIWANRLLCDAFDRIRCLRLLLFKLKFLRALWLHNSRSSIQLGFLSDLFFTKLNLQWRPSYRGRRLATVRKMICPGLKWSTMQYFLGVLTCFFDLNARIAPLKLLQLLDEEFFVCQMLARVIYEHILHRFGTNGCLRRLWGALHVKHAETYWLFLTLLLILLLYSRLLCLNGHWRFFDDFLIRAAVDFFIAHFVRSNLVAVLLLICVWLLISGFLLGVSRWKDSLLLT